MYIFIKKNKLSVCSVHIIFSKILLKIFADFFWQIHKYFQLINMYVPIAGVLNHFPNLLADILTFISNKNISETTIGFYI